MQTLSLSLKGALSEQLGACMSSLALRSAVMAAVAATENLLPPSATEEMVRQRAHLLAVDADFVTCTQ